MLEHLPRLLEISTVIAFVAFVGVIWWAYSKQRTADFNEAANLPFALPDEQEKGRPSDRSTEQ